MNLLLLFMFIFVILLCLFLLAVWSPAGKSLGSLVCDVFLCFCHFSFRYTRSGVVIVCIDS